jgi:S-adenosylmethionine-diacylgycerolhomoserine-N-methlytransferase
MVVFMSTNSAPKVALDHAQSMDRMYGVQRHIYDATRAYYLLGRDRLLRELDVPLGGRVLEVGCGTGRNLIMAAQLYPDAQFYGFDISKVMLDTAQKAVTKRGLSPRLHLALGDATNFNAEAVFGSAKFERVYISYALSMIPDWHASIVQGLKALTPGGSLHIVDFGDCADLPPGFRRGLYGWLEQFHVTPRLELEEFLEAQPNIMLRMRRPFRGYAQLAKCTCG